MASSASARLRRSIVRIRHRDYIAKVANTARDLQTSFDRFCYVSDPGQLGVVEELVAQEGKIDLAIEGLQSQENQRDLTIKFHWGHNHRFNENKFVTGRMGNRHIRLMAEFMVGFGLTPDTFRDKDVIDVGCWTGGTTLLLKHLGAKNVLALESVQKYAVTARRLVEDVYGLSGVTCNGLNLYDLAETGRYDAVYCPGVVYHLSDPVLGLRVLFNALKDGGECFVESAGLDSKASVAVFEGNRRYHRKADETAGELNRGGWNWFVPSPLCLERWMIEAGFDDVNCYYSQASNRVFGYGKRVKYVDITRDGLSRRTVI